MGRVLHERFELIRTLGEGGMGVVYEADDRVRHERVALKTLRAPDATAMYRMKREFRALADLEHPNLVRLYDLFATDDECFFTMELVSGSDLALYVAGDALAPGDETMDADGGAGRFDEAALRFALQGLLRGVSALHAAGLLHRDLKPSNVLVSDQGRVVVLDFGLVADAHAEVQQTQAGALAGTVAYMAPEQARGETELTTAIDVYAIGVILFELLTGRLPFEGPPFKILLAKQKHAPPRPSALARGVPVDLDDLAAAMLATDPAARPSVADILERLGAPVSHSKRSSDSQTSTQSVPLIGRGPEFDTLASLARSTADGAPAIAVVRGRSGIGKSALLSAFCRRAERDDHAVVLTGRCYEWETVPYKGLDGVVDALSRHLARAPAEELGRLLPPGLADLATLFPVLRRIRPIAAAYARRAQIESTGPRVRLQGFACLRELLRRIGEVAPLVVCIDDVQWSDEDTTVGLLELLRNDPAPAMLLLLGTRPSDASPIVRALTGAERPSAVQRTLQVIELGALDEETMSAIVRRELGPKAPQSLVQSIARDAGGNPFAAGELLRFLRESEEDEPMSVGGTRTVDQVIERRVARLEPSARRALESLAVAGEPTPMEVVLRSAGLPEGDRTPVDLLRVRNYTRSVRTSTGTLLDTAHDRFREAVVASLPAESRRALHRRIADVYESLEDPPHDKIARHFAAAGAHELVRHHAVAAARRATTALAFRRASELYGLAVEVSEGADRVALLPALAEARAAAGRYSEAAETWVEASRHASGREAREFTRHAGEAALHAGRIDDGLGLLKEAAATVGARIPRGPLGLLFEIVKGRILLFFAGRRVVLRDPSTITEQEIEDVRMLRALSHSYASIDPVYSQAIQGVYLLAAKRAGDPDELALAMAGEVSIDAMRGGYDGARPLLATLDGLVPSLRTPWTRTVIDVARALALYFDGRLNECVEVAEAAVARAEETGAPPWLSSIAYYTLSFAVVQKPPSYMGERFAQYVAMRDVEAGPFAELRAKAATLPLYWLQRDQTDRVHDVASRELWDRATRRPTMLRAVALGFDSQAWLMDGDLTQATVVADEAVHVARECLAIHVNLARGMVLLSRTAAAVARGREREARLGRKQYGRPRSDLDRAYAFHLEALAAVSGRDEREATAALARMLAHAERVDYALARTVANYGLGRILTDARGDAHRKEAARLVRGEGYVNPDRYLWSLMPVGPIPERTGARSLAWDT